MFTFVLRCYVKMVYNGFIGSASWLRMGKEESQQYEYTRTEFGGDSG